MKQAVKRQQSVLLLDGRKGEPVNQTTHEIHLPEKLHLERRKVCAPRTDEPLLVRDDDGRVYVVVESVPESQSN